MDYNVKYLISGMYVYGSLFGMSPLLYTSVTVTIYCVPGIIFSTPDENPGIRIVCSPAPEIG